MPASTGNNSLIVSTRCISSNSSHCRHFYEYLVVGVFFFLSLNNIMVPMPRFYALAEYCIESRHRVHFRSAACTDFMFMVYETNVEMGASNIQIFSKYRRGILRQLPLKRFPILPPQSKCQPIYARRCFKLKKQLVIANYHLKQRGLLQSVHHWT